MRLENVASLRVDVEAACLAGGPISYKVSTGGPVTIHFSDGRSLHLTIGRHEGVLPRA